MDLTRSAKVRNSEIVPTIKHLIRGALNEGRTVRDLEHDSGYRVKFQTFQELSVQAPRQFPKETKTIAGMAEALRITEMAVVLAYAASLGIPLEAQSNFAMRLPPDIDDIDVDMQNALIAVARAAARSRARIVGREQPQHLPDGTPPGWLTGQESGVLGDEDSKKRHKRRG